MSSPSWDSIFGLRTISRLYIPTSHEALLASQKALLDHFVRSPIAYKQANLPSGRLNYIELKKTMSVVEEGSTLVLMHGLGSGLGFFYANYDDLIRKYDRVYAVDWLGMGGSARPAYPKRSFLAGLVSQLPQPFQALLVRNIVSKEDIPQATDFFVDSLEEFRVHKNITSFTLMGHSLGGFLSTKYALKYPTHIKALALISPVGLPSPPTGVDEESNPIELSKRLAFIQAAWAANVTPQGILRVMGPRGRNFVKSIVNRRFRGSENINWTSEEVDIMTDYLYHISAADASGEYAMNSLLAPVYYIDKKHQKESRKTEFSKPSPDGSHQQVRIRGGVYAREPLLKDIAEAFGYRSNTTKPIPLLIMFGDKDWLAYEEAQEDIRKLVDRDGVNVRLDIIKNSGHHLYLENPSDFFDSLNKWENDQS